MTCSSLVTCRSLRAVTAFGTSYLLQNTFVALRSAFLTLPTYPTKFKTVAGNLKACCPGDSLIDLFVDWLVHIEDPATVFTPEMVVIVYPAIESARGTAKTQLQNLPLLAQ